MTIQAHQLQAVLQELFHHTAQYPHPPPQGYCVAPHPLHQADHCDAVPEPPVDQLGHHHQLPPDTQTKGQTHQPPHQPMAI